MVWEYVISFHVSKSNHSTCLTSLTSHHTWDSVLRIKKSHNGHLNIKILHSSASPPITNWFWVDSNKVLCLETKKSIFVIFKFLNNGKFKTNTLIYELDFLFDFLETFLKYHKSWAWVSLHWLESFLLWWGQITWFLNSIINSHTHTQKINKLSDFFFFFFSE